MIEYLQITENDHATFHRLLNAYYREGEDENTPQEELDSFIRLLFEKVVTHEIDGTFAKHDNTYIGFCLWAIDSESFAFSQIPGFGTILEIGLIPSYRAAGFGKNMVTYIEDRLQSKNIDQCYVSAYGPAQRFWERCGYVQNGQTASNGLPIMIKKIDRAS